MMPHVITLHTEIMIIKDLTSECIKVISTLHLSSNYSQD